MKVICINEKWEYAIDAPSKECPKYGDIDAVIREWYITGTIKPGYILQRFPNHVFAKECFIPLSDIDETVMYRELLLINKA